MTKVMNEIEVTVKLTERTYYVIINSVIITLERTRSESHVLRVAWLCYIERMEGFGEADKKYLDCSHVVCVFL